MGGQRVSKTHRWSHRVTGAVRRGGTIAIGGCHLDGFLASGLIWKLSGSRVVGYASRFNMGRTRKGNSRYFPAGERRTGDYLDLDYSARLFYWNEPPPRDHSPTDRASRCIHPGDRAFSPRAAGAVAGAGRFEYRGCASHADGNAVVSPV